MPTAHGVHLPKPKSWDELEVIIASLFQQIWQDPHVQRHGRLGQRQDGVDIYGCPGQGAEFEGVQVKTHFETGVTKNELLDEVEKAKGFVPPLRYFTLVTSAPNDGKIQQVARQVTQEHRRAGLFGVDFWGWEEVERRLADYPELLRAHYPQFHPPQSPEAAWAEERDRPRFEANSTSRSTTATTFSPEFRIGQVSGDRIANLEWRFRGPRFRTDWRHASGSALSRTHVTNTFDLATPPVADDRVGEDEFGLEIRCHWRGKWRHELHRWPFNRGDLGREILPTLYWDE